MTTAAALPPGPPPRRGVVRSLSYYAAFARDPVGFVRGRFERYGDAYYAANKDGGLVVLRHPDHLREVLSTKASSFSKEHTAFSQLSRVLGDGLLTSDGDTWTRQRRMIGPAFAPARIAEYGAVMVDEALVTVREWDAESGTRDLNDDMTALTLRVVSRALFGHDVSPDDISTVARAMHTFQRSLSSPDFLPAWVPLPSRRRLARDVTALDQLMHRLIRERMRASNGDGNGHGHRKERRDLLQMLVDAVDTEGGGSKLSVEEVRDQLVTLFLAGHETTAHALSWTFYCLAQNPEVERRLHRELDEVLGDRDASVSDLERLPYTEQVVSEALRMYPPVYGIARRAKEDVVIGEWLVPRGTEVMCWIYLTHHDPRFFPEPNEFRPERFTLEAVAALPKMAYAPFGGGPRACIGRSFAMLEARLLLATLAQRHRLVGVTRGRIEVAPRITLTPKRRIEMRVSKRGRAAPAPTLQRS